MNVEQTGLDGVLIVRPIVRPDDRGNFVKTFQRSVFNAAGVQSEYPEHFFSTSHRNVIRGMHFQTPPHAQDKFVFCPSGEVLDVVVDLRIGSPTYGRSESFRLSGDDWSALYIPAGFAHGFAAISDGALMAYLVSAEYSPGNDTGIRYDSFDFDWPVDDPIVSERDRQLPALSDFESPFQFQP